MCYGIYFFVVDSVMMSQCTGNPPTYGGSAGYPMMSQQQPQPMTTQTGPYSSPSYNPTFAAGAPPPSTYGGGDMMPSNKMWCLCRQPHWSSSSCNVVWHESNEMKTGCQIVFFMLLYQILFYDDIPPVCSDAIVVMYIMQSVIGRPRIPVHRS